VNFKEFITINYDKIKIDKLEEETGRDFLNEAPKGIRNSQVKGPVLDNTLESNIAPKKQSLWRIFQVNKQR